MSVSSLGLNEVLVKLFGELHSENILVISSKGLTERFDFSEVLNSLRSEHQIEFVSINSKLPDIEAVERLRAQTREFLPQIVVAIGGGTVMDVAKSFCFLSNTPISRYREVLASKTILSHNLQLILIPTLFGSGAESTRHAVLYVDGVKHSLVGSHGDKHGALLIPELALSATRDQRLSAGLDAVCQAIEAALSVLGSVEDKELAFKQLDNLLENFEGYVEGSDLKAMSRFAKASSEVGYIMNSTKTTAPHAASYFLTSTYNIPHGFAVSLTAGSFFANLFNNLSQLEEGSRKTVLAIQEIFLKHNYPSFEFFLRIFLEGARDYFLQMESGAEKDGQFVESWRGAIDPDRLTNHPRILEKSEVTEILWNSIGLLKSFQ